MMDTTESDALIAEHSRNFLAGLPRFTLKEYVTVAVYVATQITSHVVKVVEPEDKENFVAVLVDGMAEAIKRAIKVSDKEGWNEE